MNNILLLCVIAMSIGTSAKAMEDATSIYTLEELYGSDHEELFKHVYKHQKWINKNASKLNPTQYNTEAHRTDLTYKALKKTLSEEQISTIIKEVDGTSD